MKTSVLKIAVVAVIATLFACNDRDKITQNVTVNETSTNGNPEIKQSVFEVCTFTQTPLITAQANAAAFVSKTKSLFGCVLIRSFTVGMPDLLQGLGMPASSATLCTYQHIRVYLGLDTVGTPPSNKGFKLYICPVDSANPCKGVAGTDQFFTNPSTGQQVLFDLNFPCPNTCDVASPMFVLPTETLVCPGL